MDTGETKQMRENSQDDMCDFTMSDLAICEARRVGISPGLPYRTGFRVARRQWGPLTLKQINGLNDVDFYARIRRGSRLEPRPMSQRETIAQLEEAVRILEARVTALTRLSLCSGTLAPQPELVTGASHVRGLNVSPR
jgi:hypothetical protein